MKKLTVVIIGALLLALCVQAAEIDMSQFTCQTITSKAKTAIEPDVPYLNEILKREYVTAINNWKLNRDQGHAGAIPDPPLEYVLIVSLEKCGAWVERGQNPVLPKYVEPTPEPPPSKFGVFAKFAECRYLTILGDNAPDGYQTTAPDGTLVKKVITPTPFGPMSEYDCVKK